MRAVGDFEAMPKKEALLLSRELEKLQRNLGGMRNMNKLPDAVFIIDTKKEHIGVTEANKLGLPIVAVVDTNCDPDVIDFVIPGNDDAIRSGALLTKLVADACAEGYTVRASRTSDDVVAEQAAAVAAATEGQKAVPAAEPLAEWEIALQQEEAAAAAAQAGAGRAAPAVADDLAAGSSDVAPGHDASDTISVGEDVADATAEVLGTLDEAEEDASDRGRVEPALMEHGMGASRDADGARPDREGV